MINVGRLFILICFFQLGCGVKGKPLPPIDPVTLGRGVPSYSKASENIGKDKKKKNVIQDDWEDSNDFEKEDKKKSN